MSQAPVVNAQVINAIEVLTNSGHLTMQEQVDIYKKMLLNQNGVSAMLPVSAPAVTAPTIPVVTSVTANQQTATTANGNKSVSYTRKCPSHTEITNALAKLRLGVDGLEVARDLGTSDTYVVNLCKENGLQYVTRYGKTRRHLTDDDKAKINAMLDQGYSVVQIQIALDISAGPISRYRIVPTARKK
jgi:hypothetical protein